MLTRRTRSAIKAALRAAREAWIDNRYTERLEMPISTRMLDATRTLRGTHPPAIVVHGVMPRCGTNYVGDLLGLHPDVETYADQIWEMPLLRALPAVQALQEQFLNGFKRNRERFAENDFLAFVGESFMGYLHTHIADGKHLVMKVPLAAHLAQFSLMFPHERCLLLLRDGRDVTASTLQSWPGRDFAQVASEWRDAAAYMLSLGYPLYRYEDFVAEPIRTMRGVCEQFGLDVARYPFDRVEQQPVRGASELVNVSGWQPVAKPQQFRPVGRWSEWSPRQKHEFKRIAGDVLIRAGYASDSAW